MKRKQRPLTKAQQAAQAAGEALLAKWANVPKFAMRQHKANEPTTSPVVAPGSVRRDDGNLTYKSARESAGVGSKREVQQYSGTEMIGIGQLHKSNAQPVFSKEAAIDIAKMRRG